MAKLLKKEIRLAMHPTAPMFLALSAMLLIPNYPYYVVFFYTGLAVFFTCVTGRENNDVFYTALLPVAKKDVVKGRFTLVVLLQLAQVVVAIPFAALRQSLPLPGNQVGMDANLALFGLSLAMLGLFNLVFLGGYYKNVKQVGKPFVWACVAVFVYIALAEACAHALPFFRDKLDTPDPQYLLEKGMVLLAGAIVYAVLTLWVYHKSVRRFEAQDL